MEEVLRAFFTSLFYAASAPDGCQSLSHKSILDAFQIPDFTTNTAAGPVRNPLCSTINAGLGPVRLHTPATSSHLRRLQPCVSENRSCSLADRL